MQEHQLLDDSCRWAMACLLPCWRVSPDGRPVKEMSAVYNRKLRRISLMKNYHKYKICSQRKYGIKYSSTEKNNLNRKGSNCKHETTSLITWCNDDCSVLGQTQHSTRAFSFVIRTVRWHVKDTSGRKGVKHAGQSVKIYAGRNSVVTSMFFMYVNFLCLKNIIFTSLLVQFSS